MSRLAQLERLRDQIDTEIARERRAQAKARELLARVNVAVTRGTWNTRVCSATAAHFGVLLDEVLGQTRTRSVIDARHVAYYLMRQAGRSYSEIGREMDRDHTSIMNGVKRVEGDEALLATAGVIYAALTGEVAA